MGIRGECWYENACVHARHAQNAQNGKRTGNVGFMPKWEERGFEGLLPILHFE